MSDDSEVELKNPENLGAAGVPKVDVKNVENQGSAKGSRVGSEKPEDPGDGASRHTQRSRSSRTSQLTQKRAKAEGAKAALEFAMIEAEVRRKQAEMEAEVKRKQAEMEAEVRRKQVEMEAEVRRRQVDLEAELEILHHRKEAAKAEAEARVLENSQEGSRLSLPVEDAIDRTRRFVASLPDNPPVTPPSPVVPIPVHEPTSSAQISSNQDVETPKELMRFLLKKDLMLSRLTTFNDRPELYNSWKASFKGLVSELEVNDVEETDLLVKYLGPESSKHALSLRAANQYHPDRGLQRIWERLDERYGSPELIEAALRRKLDNFPKLTNRDSEKLYDLVDILSEIESIKEDPKYNCLLSYFDSSSGILPIINKLPYGLQEKWTFHASRYKTAKSVSFPPFPVFTEFIRDITKTRNDPSFKYDNTAQLPLRKVSAKKTVNTDTARRQNTTLCPLHNTGSHTLNSCGAFKAKDLDQRRDFLRMKGICFRCCESNHSSRLCTGTVRCRECSSQYHPTALHVSKPRQGGEREQSVNAKCTQVCGQRFPGKSCAKYVLVNVYGPEKRDQPIQMYAILDDQSNSTLAKPQFFDMMGIHGDKLPYNLASCTGTVQTSGRRARGCVIEALDGSCKLDLPTVIECCEIPDMREEIPTPEVAHHHRHLNDIVDCIPPLNSAAEILLLIGRDLIEAHHVLAQRLGPRKAPYAQKLPLGWVIVGEACLGDLHEPDFVNVNKLYLTKTGRPTLLKPCSSVFQCKDRFVDEPISKQGACDLSSDIFSITKEDEKSGLSIEDKEFIKVMEDEFHKDQSGNWVAPLPFKNSRRHLPNNRPQAVKRAMTLDRSLRRDPEKKDHFTSFMKKIFDNNHAEIAPPLRPEEECWYLPLFGVYHPKKKDQIRVVFDSSAEYDGVSLNKVLLRGPDLTNSLIGILLRFRKEPTAITADIQQMFYCFRVKDADRNYLRFLWYKDNDMNNKLTEYRMSVHVFGNSPSPAVATYGLRQTARVGLEEYGEDVLEFVERNFYVDDGLSSKSTVDETIDLMKRTQECLLKNGNLRLHKIASNSLEVMKAFSSDDRAKDLKNLDLGADSFPPQRSLGLTWDLKSDVFTFKVSSTEKPYTKRGILSTVNSLFDPLGFVAPVVIQGKLLLRKLVSENTDWDAPLPEPFRREWENWKMSLSHLEDLQIPRTYVSGSLTIVPQKEILVFCDASEKAIAAVSYLKTVQKDGTTDCGFVLGKAKVAPKHGHTIPRLELCGAVLAVEIADQVCDQLDVSINAVKFFTDSQIVLGYIRNESKRFQVYVSNRVERIRKTSDPGQWFHVATDINPADWGTRSCPAENMKHCSWLLGPTEMKNLEEVATPVSQEEPELELLVENNKAHKTRVAASLKLHRFERFSSWRKLVKALTLLKTVARKYCKNTTDTCGSPESITEQFIIKEVQHNIFGNEIESLRHGKALPKSSPILSLNPMLDENGMLRVGGRLNKAKLSTELKNPLIIPGQHHIATLLARHHHGNVIHQGRHFTEGAIRSAGLWITGGKRLINSLIYSCVSCRKQRGKFEFQKMADLPTDRLEPCPPFTFVGVDTFGPWTITTRRTRGGQANSKRWALLFTCLATRAIHIEVVEEMSSAAFINAMRRFISIRGNVTEFRSDCGTNFVGAVHDLKINSVNVEDRLVKDFLTEKKTKWTFNPPHASHMGGTWERLIGVTRRILDAMMAGTSGNHLTHDMITTLMAEVCAIVNARPLTPVSTDSDMPWVLSPATLLTQKTDHATQPMGDLELGVMYKSQWKRVQAMADHFWKRWQLEYLNTLQSRPKWKQDRPNLKNGDLVLLRNKSVHRNEWPMGVIVDAVESDDGKVRKAVIRTMKEGKPVNYTRPVTELVLLLSSNE